MHDPQTAADRDHPAVGFPPPLVYLGFVLTGKLIDRAAQLPALSGGSARMIIGALLCAAAITIAVTALLHFRRAGENPEPWTPTATLIIDGIYARTRNPMYLAMALLHAGVALLWGSIGAFLMLPIAVLIIDRRVIAAEERYLSATLGPAYDAYRSRVRRWF